MRLLPVALLPFLLVTLAAGPAAAHPVAADGNPAEWFGAPPIGFNVGRINRDATSRGEFVWLDETGDERTDFSGPGSDPDADLTRVQITADATRLHVLLRTSALAAGAPTQVQVAIDTDAVPGSGQNFLAGFSDTLVMADAQWEHLLQTQIRAGTTELDVLDAAFARSVGAGVAGTSPGVVELTVPWSALGLAGPPPRLRFTIATFREDPVSGNTVDIGGPSVSNALDVLTDYADQPMVSLNTFAEFVGGDQTINHFAQIYFAPSGEPYSPVLVAAFVSNATAAQGNEWIRIVNVSPAAVDLTGYKVGDEETPGGTESMRVLTPGVGLSPGGSIVLARSGSDFSAYFGVAPDEDISARPAFAGWSGGAIALANTNDEILLLGPDNTVLDVVSFGTAVYPGVSALMPPPAALEVAVRSPSTGDTDDNNNDFTVRDVCRTLVDCPGTGAPCMGCVMNACIPAAGATSCDDANRCNGADTCDGAGTCNSAGPLMCDDGNVCTVGSCDPALGCRTANVADGTSCADANRCDGSETCQSGACSAGTPLDCSDTNPCTATSCDPALGCRTSNVANGTSCADANACNGTETCTGGACGVGTPLDCDDGSPCTANSCDPAFGCQSTAVADGTSCADANTCNGAETCRTGFCTAGTSLDCDDGNPCTAHSCDPALGCRTTNVSDGTGCEDADLCNGAESCAAGVCSAGAPLDCDDGNPCTNNSCSSATGCSTSDVANGTSCADLDLCNGSETCTGGRCSSPAPLDCDDGDTCTEDLCNTSSGCRHAAVVGCTADAGIDAGSSDAGLPDGGVMEAGLDALPTVDGSVDDAQADVDSVDGAAGDSGDDREPAGCACRISGSASTGSPYFALGILLLVLLRRRRRAA